MYILILSTHVRMETTLLAFRILHFADLHLDSPFSWAGANQDAARRRRQALRETLLAIAELARDEKVDAILCGGDLFEHDRMNPDTSNFLRAVFESVYPIPVLISPGNHDWYGPRSCYAMTEWSPNVHIFSEGELSRHELIDGLSLWGAAHLAPANTDDFLRNFRVDGPGIHLGLFHGAERSSFGEQGDSKRPHAPFDEAMISRSGLHHAFLGHYHRPRDAASYTYPGNPDPLEFGEDGQRGAVVAEIAENGDVVRRRISVARSKVSDYALDVTGCRSRQEILDKLRGLWRNPEGFARLTVQGELDPSVDLTASDLSDAMSAFEAVHVRTGSLSVAYDIEALKGEQTVRGQFVRDVLGAQLSETDRRRVLTTGLRALSGRSDLEVI